MRLFTLRSVELRHCKLQKDSWAVVAVMDLQRSSSCSGWADCGGDLFLQAREAEMITACWTYESVYTYERREDV